MPVSSRSNCSAGARQAWPTRTAYSSMLRRPPPPAVVRDCGFALIIVLWTLVLIGFIIAHVTASGRTEIRIASNLVANSASQAAADGAIFETIFNLLDPQPERRWRVDGTP